jgi:hypothetical protein
MLEIFYFLLAPTSQSFTIYKEKSAPLTILLLDLANIGMW